MSKKPKIKRRSMMVVFSSPSGAGKTTISRETLERDVNLSMSISATTRPMRPGEEEGKDYYFVTSEEFDLRADNGEFLEHATVFGHSYGTPMAAVRRDLANGKDVLFDVDWQGAQQLSQVARGDLVSVFILPPSCKELERRLRSRDQDSEEVMQNRMAKATAEMSHWDAYDYIIVNYNIKESVTEVEAILAAERCKRARQTGLAPFVQDLCKGD